MGLMQDISLPGVFTEVINEYSTGYDSSKFGTTDSVLILGTAFNGPTGKITPIYSPEHAQYIFGGTYDSKTRKEATLVANIQDCWDRGCRTIYAFRISGKQIYKDYQLAIDTDLKLRVSGLFPSNANKDLSLLFEEEDGNLYVEIYKPAVMATMNEKTYGLVEDRNSILVNRIDLTSAGLTKSDNLYELINKINSYVYNNALRLSLVNNAGNDITADKEISSEVKIGDMFKGIYTIGRSYNTSKVTPDTIIDIEFTKNKKPYDSFNGIFFKVLKRNTDISADVPIYDNDENLSVLLGIEAVNQYDFLKVPSKIDEFFALDNVDYEEVDLSDFEKYKRLGSGFAINAHIEKTEKGGNVRYKVKEVAEGANRITGIQEGAYSMVENSTAKYRVVTGVTADSKMKAKLPRIEEFKTASAESLKLLEKTLTLKANIQSTDLSMPKKYDVEIKILDQTEDQTEITELTADIESCKYENGLYEKRIAREASLIKKDDIAVVKRTKNIYKDKSLFLVKDDEDGTTALLYTFINKQLKCVHNFTSGSECVDSLENSLIFAGNKLWQCTVKSKKEGDLNVIRFATVDSIEDLADNEDNKKMFIVNLDNGTFIIKKENNEKNDYKTLGTVEQVFSEDNEDGIFTELSSVYYDNEAGKQIENKIIIKSTGFDFISVAELADILEEDKDFSKFFTTTSTNDTVAQQTVDEFKEKASVFKGKFDDKKIIYDTNKLIPFRTSDNFVRQLAQHCKYTSLKTASTHGIIGVSKLLDTSLDAVAKRAEDLISLRLASGLTIKKPNGVDMLNKDNLPRYIGDKVSVPFCQYTMTTNDNYTYISNFAAGYAGMVSCLALDQSSTQQAVSIPDPSFELSVTQLSELGQAGFVTVKNSYSKGWVVVDGVTMAQEDSPVKRLSASRTSDAVATAIRIAAEPFIGKQNNITNKNSLRTNIKSSLDELVGKIIDSYAFDIKNDRDAAKLGILRIPFSIVPLYEIKQIDSEITVTD